MYVQPLIGPQTVTTLPGQTIEAFADHGRAAATPEQDIKEAWQVTVDLKKTGIDLTTGKPVARGKGSTSSRRLMPRRCRR